MAFDIGFGGYLAYVIGYAMAAAFLFVYRRDVIGRSSTIRVSHEKQTNAAEAA
jgi:hypothetical protein